MPKSKKRTRAKKPVRARAVKIKLLPVPAWSDPDLASKFETLDPGQRETLAVEMESKAAQLRNFAGKAVEQCATVQFVIRPQCKASILAYEGMHCKGLKEEQDKLNRGARWIMEVACTMIGQIVNQSQRRINYRDAEGLIDSRYLEDLAKESLAAHNAKQEEEEEEYRDSDGYADDED